MPPTNCDTAAFAAPVCSDVVLDGEPTTRALGVGSVPDTTEHVTVALVMAAPAAKIKP
jgi:hypothetical protein